MKRQRSLVLFIMMLLSLTLNSTGCNWFDPTEDSPSYGDCENANQGHDTPISTEKVLAWYGLFIGGIPWNDPNVSWTFDANNVVGGDMPVWIIMNMGNPLTQQVGGVIFVPQGGGGAVKYSYYGNQIYSGGQATDGDIACIPYTGLSQIMLSVYPEEDEDGDFDFYGHATDEHSGVCSSESGGWFIPSESYMYWRYENGGLWNDTEVLNDIGYPNPTIFDFYPMSAFDPNDADDAAFIALVEEIAGYLNDPACSGSPLNALTPMADLMADL